MLNSTRKILRNAFCPCGSGQKYKKCCGSPEGSTKSQLVIGEPKVRLLSFYEDDPLSETSLKQLSPKIQDRIKEIYDLLTQKPVEAIPPLEQLIVEYPEVPLLWNFLTVAYAKSGDRKKLETQIIATYEKFPNYLYAMTAFGQLCLEKGELAKIPEIFHNCFSLATLFPACKYFHRSELIAFYLLIGSYFAALGQHKLAKDQLKMLTKIAPQAKETENLGQMLNA